MRPYRIVRLIASALVAMSALIASVGSPPRITHAAAAPLCGTLIQNVSGTIAANTTWTPANIYVLTGSVTVNTGVTLTIQPGTVIKARLNTGIYVNGTLSANGTVDNPIYVTSEKDDTLCGDTNGDGTTTVPTVADWGFIEFEGGSNDTSSLTRAVLRYGGKGPQSYGSGYIHSGGPVRLLDASPNLAYLSMEQNVRNAADLSGGNWNTNALNSTTVIYWLGEGLNLAASQTLTIVPGVKLKATVNAGLYINGTLTANGTLVTPITFTSEKDDTVCGVGASDESVCDTNNALDVPAPQDWGFIQFEWNSNDTSSLTRAVLRYGGKGPQSYGSGYIHSGGPIRLLDAAPTLAHLSMEQNVRNAAEIGGNWSTSTLNSTTVIYWLGTGLNVLADQTLTIGAGVKFKATVNAGMYINGTLTANGTLATPITFTSEKDDMVCGVGASDESVCDTNNALDVPAPQDWGFIQFEWNSNDTSSLTRAVLRYGGKGPQSYGSGYIHSGGPIRLLDAAPTLAHLSMEQNVRNAAEIGGNWSTSTLNSTTVIYWLGTGLNVLANQTLTIGAGVKLKATVNAGLYVNGKLTANGTSSAPIYFTSEKDDTVCGYGASDELVCDTNNAIDGPTSQDWGFIQFEWASNDTSSLTRAVLRYGGKGAQSYGSGYIHSGGAVRMLDAVPTLAYLSMEQNVRNAAEIGGDWSTSTLNSTTVIYWLGAGLNVLANQTLTIGAGAKFKAPVNNGMYIHGKLIADGTAATDVTPAMSINFTSEKDDSVCGVGASNEQVCNTDNAVDSPTPQDWGFIQFEADSNSTSSLTQAILHYGGKGAQSYGSGYIHTGGAVHMIGVSPTIAYNNLHQNYIGLELSSGALPTLTCNDFAGNQAFGMRNNQPATVVSATGQWWNSATGPTYSANVGGTGEKISDGIAYSPWANTAC
ncbi:MAG: hypothetical protein WCK70_16225, partial [Chloroflexales bacterium]